jgi:hypothetical protein
MTLDDTNIDFCLDNWDIVNIDDNNIIDIKSSVETKNGDGMCGCKFDRATRCKAILGKSFNVFLCWNCFYKLEEIKDRKEKNQSLKTIAIAMKHIVGQLDRNDAKLGIESLVNTIVHERQRDER